jgi:hypothetical protein
VFLTLVAFWVGVPVSLVCCHMAYSSPEVQACWGFAAGSHALPSLQQLLHEAAAKQAHHRHSPNREGLDSEPSFIAQLESSHVFTSTACVAAMAAALGLSDITTSLAGTLMSAQRVSAASTAATPPAVGLAEAAASAGPLAEHPPALSPPQHQVNAGAGAAKQFTGAGEGSTAATAKAAADVAREAVWQQIDGAWAAEAVKRGVAHAKAGGYY